MSLFSYLGFNKDKIIRSPAIEDNLPDRISGLANKRGEDFSDLVKESAAWAISFSDEYMEGSVSGVGPKIMKRLKRGEFSMQLKSLFVILDFF